MDTDVNSFTELWRHFEKHMQDTCVFHGVTNGVYLTKFKMKDGAELIVETNEGWIEVDGLRISMEILRKVAKKIHDEENHYEKVIEAWALPRT